jgi:hypothetical protein
LDDNLLCYNGVEDMSKIQVMVNEIWKGFNTFYLFILFLIDIN